MDFDLTKEQEMIRREVRRFAESEIAPVAGGLDEKEAAMAKLYCSELMGRVANHAVQIHGGYGLMKEYTVERFYRDQKLLDKCI